MKKICCLIACLIFGWGCKKDKPPARAQSGSISAARRLLICNEGNFGLGNATITVYDPATGGVVPDAYAPANGNQYIGDVLQSAGRFGARYYWLVNNSKKIVITDLMFAKESVISGFISPRYISFVSNNKAYVTNLQLGAQPNYVQVVDLNTNMISKSIRIDGWTEQMAQSYGQVFVCNQRRNYVYVIDATTDQLKDSIFVNASTACIVKDKNEKLWVTCNADAGANVPARLVRIDPVTRTVEADIALQTVQQSVSALAIDGGGDQLYFLLGDAYRMAVSASAPTLAVSQGSRVFYNLAVDPYDGNLYISDAIDYNQAGTMLRYDASFNLVHSFKTGTIPGFMAWDD
jgi:hypothetical protein